MKPDTTLKLYHAMLVLMFPVIIAVWIFKSHMESKTYNKLTGAKTTTWDALWVELRVTGTAP